MPGPPPASVQTLGLPNRCAAEEASLGKLLLTSQVPSGVWTARGTSWLRLSMPGTCTCRMSLKKSPSLRIMVLGQVQPQRRLFVVQVDQVLDIVLRAPLGLHPEEGIAEDPAPDVPVVRLRAPGFVGHLAARTKAAGTAGGRSPSVAGTRPAAWASTA